MRPTLSSVDLVAELVANGAARDANREYRVLAPEGVTVVRLEADQSIGPRNVLLPAATPRPANVRSLEDPMRSI